MPIDYDKLQFISKDKIDKVVGNFGVTRTPFASSGSPAYGSHSIPNPSGMKALGTMKWSIDGVNFYPPRLKFPIPGAPAGVTVGMVVNATTIWFYWQNNTGAPVNFLVDWVLDFIDTDTP